MTISLLSTFYIEYKHLFTGIQSNIYVYTEDAIADDFVILAVQHYYVVHGKDIEQDKMKELIHDILPSSWIASETGDRKLSIRRNKGLITEEQMEKMAQAAVEKDVDVS